jgi:hypothetical protein
VAVAQLASAVLVGEQSGLADRGFAVDGTQPPNGDDVLRLGVVGAVVVGAAPGEAEERALLAVDIQGGVFC